VTGTIACLDVVTILVSGISVTGSRGGIIGRLLGRLGRRKGDVGFDAR